MRNYFDYERERRRKEVEAISGFADPRRGWEIIEKRRKARERADHAADDAESESTPPSEDKPEDEPPARMRPDTDSSAGE